MVEYNASDTRHIRRATKEAKALDADRRLVVLNLMSSPSGRNYMYARLTRCHCFATSFSTDALAMAFAEGERNIGLQDLNDCMQFAPDQYIAMMREASDRSTADDRRDSGRGTNGGRDNSGSDAGIGDGAIHTDYDLTADDGDEASS